MLAENGVGFQMKRYSRWAKVLSLICIVTMMAVIINWFTGFINSKITAGGSIICIIALTCVLLTINNTSSFKKDSRKE